MLLATRRLLVDAEGNASQIGPVSALILEACAGRMATRDEIADYACTSTRSVSVTVGQLRRRGIPIRTMYGSGYCADVRVLIG